MQESAFWQNGAMPRNVAKPLSAAEHATQNVRHVHLLQAEDETVTVEYIKRDGTRSSSTGTVGPFSGTPGMDTGSVTINDPAKGARTINLHRIIAIR